MRLLFFKTNIFMQEDWFQTLEEAGYEVHPATYVFLDFLRDDFFADKLRKRLKRISYDAVVSFNFFPVISDICHECKVPYVSWIYDSPIPNFYRFDTPYNRIYHFDKLETEEYERRGYSFIRYLPLAVNVKRLDGQLGVLEDMPEYIHDISFVGNLYNNRSMEEFDLTESPYLQGLLEGYAAAQTQFFNQDIIEPIIKTSSFLNADRLKKTFPWEALSALMHEEATHQERNHLMRKLSEHFSVDLYTVSSMEEQNNLHVHPSIGYYSEMPKVFRCSRINLNINYRAIRSGMSARILDIMGCGGFLMTTPQPEIFDFFEEDIDFVAFRSLEELIDKCAYYLVHEKERHQIAQNGYRKVKANHTYQARFPVLFAEI